VTVGEAGYGGTLRRRQWGAILIVVAVPVLCLLPFAGKAFVVDDPLFIWCGRQILNHPLDFFGFSANWRYQEEPMYRINQNPPGAAYYATPFLALFGENGTALHIAFIFPAIAASLGTYTLANRLCRRPVAAALCAVLTPGFLVCGSSTMCDTLMLAFYVWAVALWIRGLERNEYTTLAIASALIACSALTKYFGMTLIPLLLVYSLVRLREAGWGGVPARPWWWVMLLGIPVIIMAAYELYTYRLYGEGMIGYAIKYGRSFAPEQALQQSQVMLTKLLSGLTFTGGCFITSPFFALFFWSRRAWAVAAAGVVFAIGIVVASHYASSPQIPWLMLAQWVLFALGGVFVFGLAVSDLRRQPSAASLLLLLWVAGTFVFSTYVNWAVNARTVLPMAPAVGILIARRMDLEGWPQVGTVRVVGPLIAATCVSLCALWGDFTWANSARNAVRMTQAVLSATPRNVYFLGHWGFQYYMEEAGAKHVDYRRTRLDPGDVLVVAKNNCASENVPRSWANHVFTLTLPASRWVSSMQRGMSGFYSDFWGPLPFLLGSATQEPYHVYRVKTVTQMAGPATFGRREGKLDWDLL